MRPTLAPADPAELAADVLSALAQDQGDHEEADMRQEYTRYVLEVSGGGHDSTTRSLAEAYQVLNGQWGGRDGRRARVFGLYVRRGAPARRLVAEYVLRGRRWVRA